MKLRHKMVKLEVKFTLVNSRELLLIEYNHLIPGADIFRDTVLGPYGFGMEGYLTKHNIEQAHYLDDAIWVYSDEGPFTEEQYESIRAFVNGVVQSHNTVTYR